MRYSERMRAARNDEFPSQIGELLAATAVLDGSNRYAFYPDVLVREGLVRPVILSEAKDLAGGVIGRQILRFAQDDISSGATGSLPARVP